MLVTRILLERGLRFTLKLFYRSYREYCFPDETFDAETGEKLARSQMSAFIVGGGGFNGPRNSPHVIPTVDPPKRKPDMSVLQKTNSDQVINNQDSR